MTPHLEFCVQFYASCLKKDVEKVDGVQQRTAKISRDLRNMIYMEKLEELGLFNLKKTKQDWEGVLIAVFKRVI